MRSKSCGDFEDRDFSSIYGFQTSGRVDDYVSEKLKAWGLENLAEKFKGKYNLQDM